MRGGIVKASKDPIKTANMTTNSIDIKPINVIIANMVPAIAVAVCEIIVIRIYPIWSAIAPAIIENMTNGNVSAKAIMPSHTVDLVSSHVSQATAILYIHRPTVFTPLLAQ